MNVEELSKKSGISARAIQDIRRIAEQYNSKKIVLFGSRARKQYLPKSDMDQKAVSAELKKEIEMDGIAVYEKAMRRLEDNKDEFKRVSMDT